MAENDAKIVLNPHRRFGEPIVDPGGYTAETLWHATNIEGGIEAAAEAFGVTLDEVRLANRYFDVIRESGSVNPGEVRLLFDECLPRLKLDELVEFLGPKKLEGIILKHLFDLAPPGTRDEVWIPKLKDEGWTVVSADGARKPNKGRGKKLPQLCAEFGLTLIVLSPRVHQRKADDKIRTISSVWDEIVRIAIDPALKGKRYNLEPLNHGLP